MEVKGFSLIIPSFSLFFLIAYASVVSSQTDSCSSKLSVGNLIPFNTSSLSCFSAWSSEDFILRYGKTGASEWSFVLSAPDTGTYISIGFSSNGMMVGSSAMAGWVSSGGSGTVKQYYLGGTSSRSCPPDQGSLKLVQGMSSIVSQNSRLYLAFQLTGQPLQNVIYAVGLSGSLPSSSGYLPQHRSMASGTINLSSGGGGGGNTAKGGDDFGSEHEGGSNQGGSDDVGDGGGGDGGSKDRSPSQSPANGHSSGLSSKRKHGLLAIIGWGVVIPVGVAAARFFKQCDPFWFYSHISVQGIGFVLGAIALFTGFRLEDDSIYGSVGTHKTLGVVILVFGCLQVMAVLARPTKESKARKYWNWYHHYVGRATILIAIGNIFYGFELAKEDKSWSYAYGIFVGVFGVIYLVLEEWRRKNI